MAVHFIKRFRNGHLLDVSIDGSKWCLYYGNAVWSFTSSRTASGQGSNPERFRLEVIDAKTWDSRFSIELTERPVSYTHLTLPTIYSV